MCQTRVHTKYVTKPPPKEWKWVMKCQYMPLLPWPPGFFAQDQSHQRLQIQSWAVSHQHLWCWSAAPRHFHMLQEKEKKKRLFTDISLSCGWFSSTYKCSFFKETYSWRILWARSHQCHVGGCQQKAGGCLGNGQSACYPCHQIHLLLCHLRVKTTANRKPSSGHTHYLDWHPRLYNLLQQPSEP